MSGSKCAADVCVQLCVHTCVFVSGFRPIERWIARHTVPSSSFLRKGIASILSDVCDYLDFASVLSKFTFPLAVVGFFLLLRG